MIRTIDRGPFREHYLTLDADSAAALYAEAASAMSAQRIQPVQEKLYAPEPDALEARRLAFGEHGLDAAWPVTCLTAKTMGGARRYGLQLWGISPNNGRNTLVRTRSFPKTGTGRAWTVGKSRFLCISSVRGVDTAGRLPADPARQAELMFLNAAEALAAEGYTYKQVVRTWIYLRRLLDWYGDFNKVRTARYREFGLADFPASTGIQGRCLDEECVMDLLAVEAADPVDVGFIQRARQNEPIAYGSAFSRGATVKFDEKSTVYVSGTASIDARGTSVHEGDPEAQCEETAMSLAAVLASAGGGLADIQQATVFCKTPEVLEAWRRVVCRRALPEFPSLCVFADVCRPELQVEIEAVAVI